MRLDPALWDRVGGHRLELRVPLTSFQRCLVSGLPPEFAPYFLVGEDRLRSGERLYQYALEELERCLDETPSKALRPRDLIFIGSKKLTPGLLRPPKRDVADWLLVSGLPAFTVGQPRNGRRLVGDLIEVDQVEHARTGERRSHPEYLRIFKSLRRAVRADDSRVTPSRRASS